MLRSLLLILVIVMLSISPALAAVSQATFLFLTLPPSAISNGTGSALTLANTNDPLAMMTNPASLGIAAQSTTIATAFYPRRTAWLPEFHMSNLTYSSRALYVGTNVGRFYKRHPLPIYAGIGYNEVFLDIGETERRGPENEPLGKFGSWERARGITLSASTTWLLDASVGWTLKRGTSHLMVSGSDNDLQTAEATKSMYDFGFLLAAPVMNYLHPAVLRQALVQPYLTPSFAYSIMNVGGGVSYLDHGQQDPLPRTARAALGISTGLTLRTNTGVWTLFDFEWAAQGEDELIWRSPYTGDYKYRHSLGDLDVVHDLLLDKRNDNIDKQHGWEVTVLNFVSLRGGHMDFHEQDWSYRTTGFGVRLNGVLQILRQTMRSFPEDNAFAFLADHCNLEYAESRWDVHGSYSPSDNTMFRQITISYR